MTVTNKNVSDTYIANGVTTSFAYTFKLLAETDLVVYHDGALKTSGFTVSGIGSPTGGNVVFTTAPSAGVNVFLKRLTTLDQEVSYVPNDRFPAETHERALDRLTLISQELDHRIDRTLKVDEFEEPIGTISKSERSGKILGFDNDGKPFFSNFGDVVAREGKDSVTYINIAAMLADTQQFTTNDVVKVLGYYTAGDGGGGDFYFDAASTETVNGGTVFAAAGGGRWFRRFVGAVDVKWFGAKGDGVTDDRASVDAAIQFGASIKTPIFAPSGHYYLNSLSIFGSSRIISLPSNTTLRGAGKELTKFSRGPFVTSDNLPDRKFMMANNLAANITLSDFTLDGRRDLYADPSLHGGKQDEGLDFGAPKNIYISNIHFFRIGADAIDIDKVGSGLNVVLVENVLIENCSFLDIGGFAVHCQVNRSVNCAIRNCVAENCAHWRYDWLNTSQSEDDACAFECFPNGVVEDCTAIDCVRGFKTFSTGELSTPEGSFHTVYKNCKTNGSRIAGFDTRAAVMFDSCMSENEDETGFLFGSNFLQSGTRGSAMLNCIVHRSNLNLKPGVVVNAGGHIPSLHISGGIIAGCAGGGILLSNYTTTNIDSSVVIENVRFTGSSGSSGVIVLPSAGRFIMRDCLATQGMGSLLFVNGPHTSGAIVSGLYSMRTDTINRILLEGNASNNPENFQFVNNRTGIYLFNSFSIAWDRSKFIFSGNTRWKTEAQGTGEIPNGDTQSAIIDLATSVPTPNTNWRANPNITITPITPEITGLTINPNSFRVTRSGTSGTLSFLYCVKYI